MEIDVDNADNADNDDNADNHGDWLKQPMVFKMQKSFYFVGRDDRGDN